MKKKVVWLAVGCLLVVSLVLASCQPAAGPTEGTTVRGEVKAGTAVAPAVVAPTTDEPKEEEPVKPTGPQYGGSLRLSTRTASTGWDPASASYYVMTWIQHYERLMVGDFVGRGPRGTNEFSFTTAHAIPFDFQTMELAESWEWPDPLTIIFKLREGVRFHNKPPVNGRELDAEDVVVSFTRLWNVPRFLSGYWDYVESVEAVDKYTVKISLKWFNAAWKWTFGAGYYPWIYPRELVEQDLINQWEYVAGTGPFILKDYVTDVSATWVRNPDYWRSETIDGKEYQLPFVDTLQQFLLTEEAVFLAAFRTSKVDLLLGLTLERKEELERTTAHEIQIKRALPGSSYFIVMRADTPDLPTYDIRVRKALMMAVDKDDLYEKLWVNDAKYNYTSIPPVSWNPAMRVADEDLPAELVEGHSYNPEKARQLLADAGYPNGFKAEFDIESLEELVDAGSLLVNYWKDIGLDITLNVMESGAFQMKRHSDNQGMLGIQSRGGPPLAMMVPDSIKSTDHWPRWNPPGYMELLETIEQERDDDKRADMIKELTVIQALGFIQYTIGVPYSYNVWQPWVQNYYGENTIGHILYTPVWAQIWVDQDLKFDITGK